MSVHWVLLTDPPFCTLKELQDGTYSIEDLLVFSDLLHYKDSLKPPVKGKR